MVVAILKLVVIGALGGSIGSLIAAPYLSIPIAPLLLLGFGFGVGTTPLLFETIHGKKLPTAAAIVYLPSWIAEEIAGLNQRPSEMVIGGIVVFAIMCLFASLVLPSRIKSRSPMACTQCDYDMTANASGRCPECGTAWTGIPAPLPEEVFPWRTRIEAFLCWWSGVILSLGACSALLGFICLVATKWY